MAAAGGKCWRESGLRCWEATWVSGVGRHWEDLGSGFMGSCRELVPKRYLGALAGPALSQGPEFLGALRSCLGQREGVGIPCCSQMVINSPPRQQVSLTLPSRLPGPGGGVKRVV